MGGDPTRGRARRGAWKTAPNQNDVPPVHPKHPMNSSEKPSAPPSAQLLRILAGTFALGVVFVLLIVAGVTSYVRLGPDERALRNGLLEAAGPWERKLEVNLGSFTVGLARTGLLFAHLDSNARTALRTIRAGEVGIYQLKQGRGRVNQAAMLRAADRVMAGRGWDRLVGVVNSDRLVAVYASRKALSPGDFKVCVAVIDDGRLFVASARGNLEPLMELIQSRPEWRWHHRDFPPLPGVFNNLRAAQSDLGLQ